MSRRRAPDDLALQWAGGRSQDERPELGVVAVVGSGVILQDMDRRVADTADGSPVKRAKVNYQVGGTFLTVW